MRARASSATDAALRPFDEPYHVGDFPRPGELGTQSRERILETKLRLEQDAIGATHRPHGLLVEPAALDPDDVRPGQPGAVGKRLDFLMQELHREANTLGSKSVAVETSRVSLELKVLIEQMREQVQNIE